jgi:hypothetical protein
VTGSIQRVNVTRGFSWLWEEEMKLPERVLAGQREVSIINQEIIRAKSIIAEIRLNNQKARELRHTARNLMLCIINPISSCDNAVFNSLIIRREMPYSSPT